MSEFGDDPTGDPTARMNTRIAKAAGRAAERARKAFRDHEPVAANQIGYVEGLAVLTEEVGEAARAALHAHFGDPEVAAEGRGRLQEELLDVAAAALLMLERLQREEGAP